MTEKLIRVARHPVTANFDIEIHFSLLDKMNGLGAEAPRGDASKLERNLRFLFSTVK